VAAHPPQEELDADVVVVSPPLPLLTKPQEDMRRVTFLLLQEGQSGFSDPKTNFSKLLLQSLQQYSYIGMGASPYDHFIGFQNKHQVNKVNCCRHSATSAHASWSTPIQQGNPGPWLC
jgi:hypothetical protein